MGIFTTLGQSIGCGESALKLIISVVIAYPIGFFYRKFLHKNPNVTKNQAHLFFAACGILICIFNYGIELYHSLLAVVVTYLIHHLFYKSELMVPLSFVFNMGYLLVGYYVTTTENYDIKWTMAQCVQALHLIGLTFDVADNIKQPDVLGITDNRPVKIPTLLEIFSFIYFPATILVGPQFSFKRFNDFLDKKFDEGQNNFEHGLKRGAIGCFYLAVYQIGGAYVSDSYLQSQEFRDTNLFIQLLWIGAWGRCTLYKYISVWLMSEGAATCFGLSYVGRDPATGKEDWSGCANIKLYIFENTKKYNNYVDSFNLQTNLWVLKYVYKRLKFLGNRNISHLSALLFLAVWHGFHSGYYMTFFLEFMVIHFEKQVEPLIVKNQKIQAIAYHPVMQPITFLLLKFYSIVFVGWFLIPFALLSFTKWWAVYKSTYFIGFILFLPASYVYLPIIKYVLNTYLPNPKAVENVTKVTNGKEADHAKVN